MTDNLNSWPQPSVLQGKGPKGQARLLIQATIRRYPSSAIGPENVEAFANDWADMIREIGLKRFYRGLQLAIQSTSFFPVLADIRRHLPAPQNLAEYTGPSPEDIARKASGERSYGLPDVKYLSHLHAKARMVNGDKPLSQRQLDSLLDELDAAINQQEAKAR